ncbi:MAG: dihydrofolate reductase [Raineya sp.]|jgi:dihydrofolate reductase|nr:dihydrofolate reductase [Raineya sp.]
MTSLVVAVAENNIIGIQGRLPWRLSDDLKFFKHLTENHVLIMGRKTFESLPKKLPNRVHIIVTRNKKYNLDDDDCFVVSCLDEALDFSKTFFAKQTFVIGGGEIYQQALDKKIVDKIYLTKVKAQPEGDTFFINANWDNWEEKSRTSFFKGEKNEFDFDIIELIKK